MPRLPLAFLAAPPCSWLVSYVLTLWASIILLLGWGKRFLDEFYCFIDLVPGIFPNTFLFHGLKRWQTVFPGGKSDSIKCHGTSVLARYIIASTTWFVWCTYQQPGRSFDAKWCSTSSHLLLYYWINNWEACSAQNKFNLNHKQLVPISRLTLHGFLFPGSFWACFRQGYPNFCPMLNLQHLDGLWDLM